MLSMKIVQEKKYFPLRKFQVIIFNKRGKDTYPIK